MKIALEFTTLNAILQYLQKHLSSINQSQTFPNIGIISLIHCLIHNKLPTFARRNEEE